MEPAENNPEILGESIADTAVESDTSPILPKSRKRKRLLSNSDSSSDEGIILPENSVDVERKLHAVAIKNNISEKSMKHILKKVVTNDHVLALVQLREEEEGSGTDDDDLPKITRAKAKELMKESNEIVRSAPWNLELTPIKHIHVKTRPEVTALMDQELPDESDEEYEPTHDDVPGDDDQTLEPCSDLESQPKTPATPATQAQFEVEIIKDGPFTVPQELNTPKKVQTADEPTIALRTRSKLCLQETPIEHIEGSFVPPDELPCPAVDDLWNQFLNECLDPGLSLRNEDDDEADPEYNIAADLDAQNPDEEALENTVVEIDEEELSDLVAEIFNLMPMNEESGTNMYGTEHSSHINNPQNNDKRIQQIINSNKQITHMYRNGQWVGKQEPISDTEEVPGTPKRRKSAIGKIEPPEQHEEPQYTELQNAVTLNNETVTDLIHRDQSVTDLFHREQLMTDLVHTEQPVNELVHAGQPVNNEQTVEVNVPINQLDKENNNSEIDMNEFLSIGPRVPLSLKETVANATKTQCLEICIPSDSNNILPEQIAIIQQQLRQHIQLAVCNFLQIYVHPMHWRYAPTYKEYLETLYKMSKEKENSIVNVCNLKASVELAAVWEKTVSEDTPENKRMIEFLQRETDRCSRKLSQNSVYNGEFHPTFMQVVANSSVVVYPHLLPAIPYRSESCRRLFYTTSEDELFAIGLDEFWSYVENNPELYPPPKSMNRSYRWGVSYVIELICKYQVPFATQRAIGHHINNIRKGKDPDNPIFKFFKNREIKPVKHKLLSFNPNITLYEQPEHEMPRTWIRYLAKTSLRFKKFLKQRAKVSNLVPVGVDVDMGNAVTPPAKKPLPAQFTRAIVKNRFTHKMSSRNPKCMKQIISLSSPEGFSPKDNNEYSSNETPEKTSTRNNTGVNVSSPKPSKSIVTITCNRIPKKIKKLKNKLNNKNETTSISNNSKRGHCKCCSIIRKMCKERQSVITEFFKPLKNEKCIDCLCQKKEFPKITSTLRMFLDSYNNVSFSVWKEIHARKEALKVNLFAGDPRKAYDCFEKTVNSIEDSVFVTNFQLKLFMKSSLSKNPYLRKRLDNVMKNFNRDNGSVLWLTRELETVLITELPHTFREFLLFLTEEQVDKLYKYRDYFIEKHLIDFLDRIKIEVKNLKDQVNIITNLDNALLDYNKTSCDICCSLLPHLKSYPNLAKYYFSLFPHRHKNWKSPHGIDNDLQVDSDEEIMDEPSEAVLDDQNTDTDEDLDNLTCRKTSHQEENSIRNEADVEMQSSGSSWDENEARASNSFRKPPQKENSIQNRLDVDMEEPSSFTLDQKKARASDSFSSEDDVPLQRFKNLVEVTKTGIVAGERNCVQQETTNQHTISMTAEQKLKPHTTELAGQHTLIIQATPEEHSTEKPTPEETTLENPTPEETALEKPTPEETATEKPTPEEIATEKPTPEEIATEKPTPEETATEKPTPEETALEKPTPEETATEKPATEEPTTEQPTPEEPSTEEYILNFNIKTEVGEFNESIASSIELLSEECTIKEEPLEWTRDEDKKILEVIKQSVLSITSSDNENIENVLEKNNIYYLLKDYLEEKPLSAIRERVLFIVKILVNEKFT